MTSKFSKPIVTFKCDLPWTQWEKEELIEPCEVLKVIYMIDSNEDNKQTCFLSMERIFRKNSDLSVALDTGKVWMEELDKEQESKKGWKITIRPLTNSSNA